MEGHPVKSLGCCIECFLQHSSKCVPIHALLSRQFSILQSNVTVMQFSIQSKFPERIRRMIESPLTIGANANAMQNAICIWYIGGITASTYDSESSGNHRSFQNFNQSQRSYRESVVKFFNVVLSVCVYVCIQCLWVLWDGIIVVVVEYG